ncbi:MAG: hypothetical protein O7G84_00930 [Gammaproteobacteria bacterium]|nr:hypothetical protein [Gammaproteobacteria bacterium]
MADHVNLEATVKALRALSEYARFQKLSTLDIGDAVDRALHDLLCDSLEADPAQDSAPGDGCEVSNHFNLEAAADGECEWCADITKAHAAGRDERAAEFVSAAAGLRHDGINRLVAALLVKLPDADDLRAALGGRTTDGYGRCVPRCQCADCGRPRLLAQMLVEVIGSVGPESAEDTVARAVVALAEFKG